MRVNTQATCNKRLKSTHSSLQQAPTLAAHNRKMLSASTDFHEHFDRQQQRTLAGSDGRLNVLDAGMAAKLQRMGLVCARTYRASAPRTNRQQGIHRKGNLHIPRTCPYKDLHVVQFMALSNGLPVLSSGWRQSAAVAAISEANLHLDEKRGTC